MLGPGGLRRLPLDRDDHGIEHLGGWGKEYRDTAMAVLGLREQVRSTDVVGRWGGEEFIVLLRRCGLQDAVVAAEKLRRQIADMQFDNLCSVSVSIGAAQLQPDEDLESWLGRADAALYRAKAAGRNNTVTA